MLDGYRIDGKGKGIDRSCRGKCRESLVLGLRPVFAYGEKEKSTRETINLSRKRIMTEMRQMRMKNENICLQLRVKELRYDISYLFSYVNLFLSKQFQPMSPASNFLPMTAVRRFKTKKKQRVNSQSKITAL